METAIKHQNTVLPRAIQKTTPDVVVDKSLDLKYNKQGFYSKKSAEMQETLKKYPITAEILELAK